MVVSSLARSSVASRFVVLEPIETGSLSIANSICRLSIARRPNSQYSIRNVRVGKYLILPENVLDVQEIPNG